MADSAATAGAAIVNPGRLDVTSNQEASGHQREHRQRHRTRVGEGPGTGDRTPERLAPLGDGHPPPADPRLPPPVVLDHRHGRRQPAHRRRRTQADLRHHRLLRLGRRRQHGGTAAAHRVRAVGRRDRRHHGPPQAPADHQQRDRCHLGAVLGAGRRRPRLGGRADGAARDAAGVLGPQRARPQRLHRPPGLRRPAARRQRPRLDRDADRAGRRTAPRGRPHPGHRPARAVSHRRAGPVCHALGGREAALAAAPGVRDPAPRGLA